jgi:CubicO group peptidase (beta-lactamase class C family)
MQRSISGSTRFASKPYFYAAMMIATLGLAACGGGGGDDSPPPSSPSTQPPPPPPGNTAPTVTAGVDQTIKLPTNAVDLSGTATDPENNTLTYAWTSSPADGVTFADAAAAATRATFTTAGTYTLTLTANDGTTTGSDTLAVIVEAEDAPPPPPPTETAWPGPDSETDPNHGWAAVANPADVGMDAAKLQEASAYALTGGGAGMIVRHGRLVHQWTDTEGDADPANDFDIDDRLDVKSTTKSMGGIALGLALNDNLLALDDLAQSRLPHVGAAPGDPTPNDPAWLAQIKIRQLATHTAGFEKSGGSWSNMVAAPGAEWRYSDGGLNWLADTLTNVFQRDLRELLFERVFTPLGITTDDLVWRVADAGRPPIGAIVLRELNSGMTTNANAMARVGLLFLRNGEWNGQRILPESFVQAVRTPHAETAAAALVDPAGFPSADEGYGLLWWTNATGQLPNVPRDAYWAWGLGDSLIVVIPSLDLVISRVGNHPDTAGIPHWRTTTPGGPAAWNGNYEVLAPFLNPIVQSVTPAP